jgi:hypothetical protein
VEEEVVSVSRQLSVRKKAVQFGLAESIRPVGLDPRPNAQRRTFQRIRRRTEDLNEHEHDLGEANKAER